MTNQEIIFLLQKEQQAFDTARLVDLTRAVQYTIDEQGELKPEPYRYFSAWGADFRPEIDLSMSSSVEDSGPFEYRNQDMYYVVCKHLVADGRPWVLELASFVGHEILFGNPGQNMFISSISDFNQKMYKDSLTGAYNRRYYEEQLFRLGSDASYAMIDVDDFKGINDHYGHRAGDHALKAIVTAIISCIRSTDVLIRYGGDEFLLIFKNIPPEVFSSKLERIRLAVTNIKLDQYPDIQLSISIGGEQNPGGRISAEDAILAADQRLYQAKARKNTVCIGSR